MDSTPAVDDAPATARPGLQPPRDGGIDALRAGLTLLVLWHHTAITYGASGGWFYREVAVGSGWQPTLLTFFCAIDQAYFMGLFFLIAGAFTPASYDRKGPGAFVRDRLLRLGLPLLAFGFVLGPATVALADTADSAPFLATLLRLWHRPAFINGPLWFAQALLIFGGAYALWRSLAPRRRPVVARPFPGNATLAAAALLTGGAAFALRLVWPVGTNAFGLQIGYFASYTVLFVAGCIAGRHGWLTRVPARQLRVWLGVALASLPVLPAMIVLVPNIRRVAGGWNLPALIYAVWEPLVAWGVILGLLTLFERRFQNPGPLWAALSRRAYMIYIIHPPVLVAIALGWRMVAAAPLVKFAITGTLTCVISFWLAGLLLRIPTLRRII